METREIEVFVEGKVTMVGFRNFVLQKARGLGIFGYTENTRDFRLHVVAQSTKESLDTLIEQLHKGPFNAKVRNAEVTWREPKEKFRGFEIIY